MGAQTMKSLTAIALAAALFAGATTASAQKRDANHEGCAVAEQYQQEQQPG